MALAFSVGDSVTVEGFGPGKIIETDEDDFRGLPYVVRLDNQDSPLVFSEASISAIPED